MSREVYLLTGQSNMVGRGVGSPTYTHASRIYRYSQPWGEWGPVTTTNPGGGTWALAADPLHSHPLCGIGPGIAFADRLIALRNDPTLEIGLVPCAMTGSSEAVEWEPAWRTWRPFAMAVARGHAAKACGPIAGIIHYGGESMAKGPTPYAWVQALWRTMTGLRMELGDLTLPVIVTQLGPNPLQADYPGWASIQTYTDAMHDISPWLRVVSAKDLPTIPGDPIHLSADAAVTLGTRYGDAMHAMTVMQTEAVA